MPPAVNGGPMYAAAETIYSGVAVQDDFEQGNIMRNRMLAFIAAMFAYLCLLAPSFANSLSFDFTILNGGPSASGGYGTFTLNADGTIAASLTSHDDDGPIIGFGFASVISNLPQSGFSVTPIVTGGWSTDIYGVQNSGFSCNPDCGVTSITWTIGNLHEFTSVIQALGGNPTYNFFMLIGGDKWAANAVLSQTPLPAALPLFAVGLGVMGLFGWRRKQKATAIPVV